MSCPINQESIQKLKLFIDICSANPEILHMPDLVFFKNYIETLGGRLPQVSKSPKSEDTTNARDEDFVVESDIESDLEIDNEGCVDPDSIEDSQKMGNPNKEVTEEDADNADVKRVEASSEFASGNFQNAIKLYTEAIESNPQSALMFAKRGQAYLKLNKPNACIRDCSRALELNPDSATGFKFRGRAYRLLGQWEKAAKDLRQACTIDMDEQTDEWLKEVTPNAQKIEQHELKQERRKLDREEKEKRERLKKAKQAHAEAAAKSADAAAGEGVPPEGGIPGMDFYKFLQDPELRTAFQDPEVAAAFADISTNPGNILKYHSNPKIRDLLGKLSQKFTGSGMNFPFGGAGAPPNMGGPAPGGPAPTFTPPDDDNLD